MPSEKPVLAAITVAVFNLLPRCESRAQFERHNENHYPDSADRSIIVAGDFVGGGFTGQESQDHTIQLEFQNISTVAQGNRAIRFGTRLRDTRDANLTNASFNGKFVFSPVTVGQTTYAASQVYEMNANGQASGHTFNSLVSPGDWAIVGKLCRRQRISARQCFDIAFFAQDDVKINPRLTVSGGLRWEAQNHIADHDDRAPRAEFAFALDGGKGRKSKTVLRAGYGFFYDRFVAKNFLTLKHTNEQTQIVLNNPICTSTAASLNTIDMTTCSSGVGTATSSAAPVQYEIAPHFHADYIEQLGASL